MFKSFVDKYFAEANHTYCMVYLFGLRFFADNAEVPSDEYIADSLRIMESDVEGAWRFWQRKGLIKLERGAVKYIRPKSESKMSEKAVAQKIAEDNNLAQLCLEAETLFGGTLSSKDTQTLFWLYENLDLPTDVLIMLISYAQSSKKGMRYIEKTAINWDETGINTVEKADELLQSLTKPKKKKSGVKKTKFSNFEQRETSYSDLDEAYFEEILKGMNKDGGL